MVNYPNDYHIPGQNTFEIEELFINMYVIG